MRSVGLEPRKAPLDIRLPRNPKTVELRKMGWCIGKREAHGEAVVIRNPTHRFFCRAELRVRDGLDAQMIRHAL